MEKMNSMEEMLVGEVVVSFDYSYEFNHRESIHVENRSNGFTSENVLVSIQNKASRSISEKFGSSKHFHKKNLNLHNGCLTIFENGNQSKFSCDLAGASIKRCTRFHIMQIILPGKHSHIIVVRFADAFIAECWNEMIQRAVLTTPEKKSVSFSDSPVFSSVVRTSLEDTNDIAFRRWQYLVSNPSTEKTNDTSKTTDYLLGSSPTSSFSSERSFAA
uniref:Uncharacterized protein n=1 Tax=Timspurckia oligopyrenoides TaxID=708627 RepID=A0A7S0ZCG4_9RHOD|mmetsp:Transcript_12357/g.22330  ORF Transcript_12357/g.22330 Transcript_12357/m.22330 type:complete len:217 (+) Transcript_12357:111-761(+)